MKKRGLGTAVLGCLLIASACGGRASQVGRGGGDAGQAGGRLGEAGVPATGGSASHGGDEPGAAGLGGQPLQGGEPGIGGWSGDAGAAGVAGASGFGGVAGDDPPPVVGVNCDGEPFELDAERVRQCVLLGACGADLQQASECVVHGADPAATQFTSGHVTYPDQPDARADGCLGSLRSCADVMACTGEGRADAECQDDPTSRCEGELAITCGSSPHVQDCRKLTGKSGNCRVQGQGAQAVAACAVDVQADCTGKDDARRVYCDGTVRYGCRAGVAVGVDCAEFGLSCAEEHYDPAATGYAQCVRPPPTTGCAAPGTGACNGTKIELCALGGVSFVRDCSAVGGLTCYQGVGDEPTDHPWFDCVPAGCSMRFETNDACDGDDLMLAMDSSNSVRIHCPDYGFATCQDGDGSNPHCAN